MQLTYGMFGCVCTMYVCVCLVAVRKCLIIRLTGLVCLCGHWFPPETNSHTHSRTDIRHKTIHSKREKASRGKGSTNSKCLKPMESEWKRKRANGNLLVKRDFKREVMRRHNRTERDTENRAVRGSPLIKRFPVSLSIPSL